MKRNWLAFATMAATVVALGGFTLVGCSDDDDNPAGPGPTGGFNSGTLNTGASYSHTFPTAGVFGYHCIPHQSMGMTGTVNVTNGAADSALVTASGMVFTPTSVNIRPGGTVRWTVASGTHTVTSH